MIDFVRKNIVIITAAVLAWMGWSFLDEGNAKKEANAKASLAAIPAACLALRDVAAPLPSVLDPYHCERFPSLMRVDPATASKDKAPAAAAARGSATKPPATAGAAGARRSSTSATKAATTAPRVDAPPLSAALPAALPFELPSSTAQLAALILGAGASGSLSMRDAAGQAALLWAPPVAPAKAAPAEPAAAAPRRSFTLVLQSTIDMPDARQARVCGRTVMEGETLPFLDAVEPPLLEKVSGSGAVVLYGGRRYALDVNACPMVVVGEPAAEKTAAAKPAAASGAKAAPPKGAPKPKAAAAAAPAAKSAAPAKGTYRVRGKNKKP